VILIGNVRNVRDWLSTVIYVGRPIKSSSVHSEIQKGSVLGNPFVEGKDGSREVVIEKYRKWLWAECCKAKSPVKDELMRLVEIVKSGKTIVLVCWCDPLPCHASVIKRAIEFYITGKQQTPKPPSVINSPKAGEPERFVNIKSNRFYAGVIIGPNGRCSQTAPILRVLKGMNFGQIRRYCEEHNWEIVETGEHKPKSKWTYTKGGEKQ